MKKYIIICLKFIKSAIILRFILELKKWNLLPKFLSVLILGYDYQRFKFENIDNLSLTQPQKINFLFNRQVTLSYSPLIFDNIYAEPYALQKVVGFKKYSAVLNKVKVIGGSNLVLFGNNKALYDLKFNYNHKNIRFSDQGMHYYRADYCLIKNKKGNISFDSAISLVGNYSWNYFHFLYEILTKFEEINKLDLDSSIPIIVDKITVDVPQYLELLSYFNTQARKIIPIDKEKIFHVDKLFYFSSPNVVPPNFIRDNEILPQDLLYDLTSLNYLRAKLIPCASKVRFPNKIFISRSNASIRRKFNEVEIYNMLEKYGFSSVCPENYSIADQISLFSNADIIVGGSGAAFSNLLFCKKKTKVLILIKNRIQFTVFSTLANHQEVELIYLAEVNDPDIKVKDIHDPFYIDPNRIEKLITQWI